LRGELNGLREQLLVTVRERGGAVDALVASALRTVPRHIFLPDLAPAAAYEDAAIVTKWDAEGLPSSSSSQPTIMAIMLDQLEPARGQKVLEIGAGTGFNAALIAHIVGPKGSVVSIDLDPEIVARAEENLSAAGTQGVTVLAADGALGDPAHAPYDRIIATVGVWDIAPAWHEQLAPGGLLVVPLDLRGIQRSVCFERAGDHWTSRSSRPCGFMRMRGPFAGPDRAVVLDPGTHLTLLLPDARELDTAAVLEVLGAPEVEIATGVSPAAMELFDGFGLWLAIHEPRWFALSSRGPDPRLPEAPLRNESGSATSGLLDEFGLATLAMRDGELLVIGTERIAEDLAAHVAAWDEAGRPGSAGLVIDAYPIGGDSIAAATGELVIDKKYVRLVLTWG
jgi:protein-L-isoaspartate(D-aspartate) O-methyltransferase